MRRIHSFIGFLFAAQFAFAQLPDGFVRQQLVSGLNPTKMVLAPDGRIFLAEKHGDIRIVRDDQLLEDPFLSIEVDENNERGLSGIVLDPDFEQNHWVYIYYTVPGVLMNRVSRFTASGDRAVPGSEVIIYELDQLRSDVHNGGDMHFGLDGKLYITVGDGGYSWLAASTDQLFGKVLRINKDGSIPEDNPYYEENTGKYRAIYASGFRNPFTSALHPITGVLYLNDVGSNKWEEINIVESGKFYGWEPGEGMLSGPDLPANYKNPFYTYDHDNGCAIVGATVYEPDVFSFPEQYWGKYFFGDYCKGQIRMLDLETGTYEGIFMTDANRLIFLMTHPDGTVYYLERRGRGDGSPWDNTSTTDGTLNKISYTGSGAPFISIQPRSTLAVAGESAEFEVEAIGAGLLEYGWFQNDVLIPNSNQSTITLSNVLVQDDQAQIKVKVWNAIDTIESQVAVLSVTANQRPQLTITSPENGYLYHAGESIQFAGMANDPETGMINADAIGWRVDFHHNDHTHPATTLEFGANEGTFDIPTTGEIDTNVWYRIYMIAEDAEGLSQSAFTEIFPLKSEVQVNSKPTGLKLNADGLLRETPFEMRSVVGVERTVLAPVKQLKGDSLFFFKFWSDGATTPVINVKASNENAQLVQAEFRGMLKGNGNGLTVSYYDNQDLIEPPVKIGVDSVIDYLYHVGPPIEGLPEDFWSIRWEGYLLPYQSDLYRFSIACDDGVRLWIGDELLIDAWTGGLHFEEATKRLEEGKLYPIKLEYFELEYGAYMTFKWAASHFGEEVVPQFQMYEKEAFNIGEETQFELAPNPARGETHLNVYSLNRGVFEIEIRDMQGHLVSTQVATFDFGENRIWIPIDGMIPGVYQLQCLERNRRVLFDTKLIVQ